ncbi:MAG: hypothetical protein LUC90_05115, partial [Lachnospiraceae bacterium]|nr:hypothetical protein [Lachnospiraceae bacterium]
QTVINKGLLAISGVGSIRLILCIQPGRRGQQGIQHRLATINNARPELHGNPSCRIKKGRRKQGCRKFNNRQSVSLCPFFITNLNSNPFSAPNLIKKEQKNAKDKIWHLHSWR